MIPFAASIQFLERQKRPRWNKWNLISGWDRSYSGRGPSLVAKGRWFHRRISISVKPRWVLWVSSSVTKRHSSPTSRCDSMLRVLKTRGVLDLNFGLWNCPGSTSWGVVRIGEFRSNSCRITSLDRTDYKVIVTSIPEHRLYSCLTWKPRDKMLWCSHLW
jgi:hypothetical protein